MGDDVLTAIIGSLMGVRPSHADERVREAVGVGPTADGDYRSPHGRHRHQCERCHTVWEHDDMLFATRAGHTCPNPQCGHCEEGGSWEKYFGADAPAYHDPGERTFRKADGGTMLPKAGG